MIVSSRSVKLFALSAAIVAHASGISNFRGEPEVLIEGGAGSVEAQIGSSFADLTAGVMTAEAVEDVVESTQPTVVTESEPDQELAELAEPEALEIQREEPKSADVDPTEDITERPETEIAEPAPVPEPETQISALSVEPVPQLEAVVPIQPVEESEETEKPDILEVLEPEKLEPLESAEEPVEVARSVRPKTRTPEFEKKHEDVKKATKVSQTPKKTTSNRAQQKTVKGNAKQNTVAGATTANNNSDATTAGQRQGGEQGNAAVSNYPGLIMKKISRVPKPRVGNKGTAVIAFRVASNGGLSVISLARSSGSANLDQAALRVIRRAAPFPPPPAGARRSFSIKIKGR
ncbi:MAG: TonB family protein [Pseudomonadota bacterium]